MKVKIIAEAGVNHNGSIDLAKQLIDVAADSGADIVKFQTFKADALAIKKTPKAEYQLSNTSKSQSHYEMLKQYELSHDMHQILIEYCKKKNITFFSTAFDILSLNYLNSLGFNFFKIPSGEITNLPYLRHISSFKKPIILSTGMSTMHEIDKALNIFIDEGLEKKNITILHCNTEYPTPIDDVNLNAMLTIKNKFNINVGYSDHTLGTEVAIAAVALGATVIEKHFTLDRDLPGPDHKASLTPKELKIMVNSVRNIEKALGNGNKVPSKSEIKNIVIARKSIVALKKINKGEVFSKNNIGVKRPGSGISPMLWDKVIGKIAIKDFNEDELIEI